MTAAEKILARASGLERVRAGEIVYPTPEFVIIHDGVVMGTKQELDQLGIDSPVRSRSRHDGHRP